MEKLVAGTYTAQVTPVSFIVMVGTLVVNLFVTLYERRAGKRLKERFVAKTGKIFLAQLVCRINNAFARNRIQNIKNHVSRNGS